MADQLCHNESFLAIGANWVQYNRSLNKTEYWWQRCTANSSTTVTNLFVLLLFRLFLAVLHYNENSVRTQARNHDGDLQYTLAFPKANFGDYTLKKVMEQCSFGEWNKISDKK